MQELLKLATVTGLAHLWKAIKEMDASEAYVELDFLDRLVHACMHAWARRLPHESK